MARGRCSPNRYRKWLAARNGCRPRWVPRVRGAPGARRADRSPRREASRARRSAQADLSKYERSMLAGVYDGKTAAFGGPDLDRSRTRAKLAGVGLMPKRSPQAERDLATIEKVKVVQPRLYEVVLHNDDYTTKLFVVYVLIKFFHHDDATANEIMLHVHTKGAC